MSDPWVIRAYDPVTDENGVVYLWLKSFAHSSFGRVRGAHVDGSDGERAYWAAHKEIVLRLLSHAETKVLCDPEDPLVIWAFACAKGDVVHYAVVKRKFREFSGEMFRALLGDRFDRPCMYTHELSGTGLQVPSTWMLNPYAFMESAL